MAPASLLKINIGCGHRWKSDWKNIDRGIWTRFAFLRSLGLPNRLLPSGVRGYPVDLIRWDLRRVPLPFPDASASALFSQYVLEYLTPDEAMRLLRDCRRLLAPGGVIRLCQTDIGAFVAAYLAAETGPTPASLKRSRRFLALSSPQHTELAVRLFRRGGVQQLFDASTLEWMLTESGFTDIRFREMHQGDCPDLAHLEAEYELPLVRVEAGVPTTPYSAQP